MTTFHEEVPPPTTPASPAPASGDVTLPLSATGRKRLTLLWSVAIFTAVMDQLAKAGVRKVIPFGGEHPLLPGWLHLSHAHNQGAAWGVLSGHRWLLIAIALGVVLLVANVAREIASRSSLAACGLGFIVGGAMGNLIDRITQGYVTDFMDLDTPVAWLRTFPIWNLADGALTVGAVLMAVSFLMGMRHPAGEERARE